MGKSETKIYIVDDELTDIHPICVKLKELFRDVELFNHASDAIVSIKNLLGSKMVLLLDLKLSGGESGYKTLADLRELSYQIPVVIWTGLDERTSEFFSLINFKTYAIREKTASIADMVELVQQANEDITYSLSNALERWIMAQPGNHDDIFSVSIGGKSYSLNQILDDVRKDTLKGKECTQDLVNLTIELMEKENHE